MKRVFEKIERMFRMRDCRGVCLFCEYYDICKHDDPHYKTMQEQQEGPEK